MEVNTKINIINYILLSQNNNHYSTVTVLLEHFYLSLIICSSSFHYRLERSNDCRSNSW